MGFLRSLLSHKQWVYALSLLIPFIVYDLALKASSLASIPGLALSFYLLRSDVFFDLGYALLWIGFFAVAPPTGAVRRLVVVLFHLMTGMFVLVDTSAYEYFKVTGTALDYSVIAFWLPNLKEISPVLAGAVPLSAWLLLLVALFYVALGPWLLVRTISRWREWESRACSSRESRVSLFSFVGLWLLAFGFGSLSLLLGASWRDYPPGTSATLVRGPVVNVLLTSFEVEEADAQANSQRANYSALDGSSETDKQDPGFLAGESAARATLVPTSQAQKQRNVVLIHLESTRAESTTPYNSSLKTTPFLDALAKSSLLAEQYYTTVEHTSKAIVSVNCGIEAHLIESVTEAKPGGIPAPCLAELLEDQGYNTVFFQSSTEDFEDFRELVKNFGYEDYYPLETMDTEGFPRVNYFGYEDSIMLKPSQQWLEEHKDKPFVASYLLGDGHQNYGCPDSGYEEAENSKESPQLKRYLNCMRLQDTFVQNLFQQYQDLGLYENTIFVIYGDHGEGFGEHGLYIHDDIPYHEGLRVPLLIHAPGLVDGSQRVGGLSNHTDILPTVLEMLGYELKEGRYPGYSLLHPIPEERPFYFSCFHKEKCLASIKGEEEYIYHYDNQPDEVYDLRKDPLQQNNLASQYSKEELDKRRDELLSWQAGVNAVYTSTGG